jgi:hypothetical protein
MLITFFRKPGGQIDEQVGFSKKVRPSDEQTCNVILDFKDRKVLKCVIEGKVTPTSFEKMHEYYKQIYPQLVEQLEKMQQDTK